MTAHGTRYMLLAVTVAATATLAVFAGPRDAWTEVRSPGFTIFGAVGEERSVALASRLERLRTFVSLWAPGLGERATTPVYVYVFPDGKAARGYLADPTVGGKVGGTFLDLPHADYIVIDGDADLDTHALAYHEVVHSIVSAGRPDVPLWLNEGLAELFGTFWANEHEAELGTAHEDLVALLRQRGMMPWETLLDTDAGSADYRDAARKRRFHAQAWLLVHWWVVEDPARRSNLWTTLRRSDEGTLASRVRVALGTDLDALDRTLREYLMREELPTSRLQLPRLAAPTIEARPMPRADVHYRLGDLLTQRGEASSRAAAKQFRKALALEPDHPGSLAGMGLLHSREGRDEEAADAYRRAIASAGADASPAWVRDVKRALARVE